MKETIYTEFRSQLVSKESTITDLQEKNCEAEKSLAEIEKCLPATQNNMIFYICVL